MLNILFSIFFVLVAFSPRFAQAYPNMVRHGYTTCLTCHYNASGGGSLTSYGKYIAGETLGTFNDSETALPWLTKPVDYEDKNKDFSKSYVVAFLGRGVQYQFENDSIKRSDRKLMQADLEGAFDLNGWVGLITGGPRLASKDVGQKDTDLFLRRWYVGRQTQNYSVKAGQFFPEYGINLPNHNALTRKNLFFNHNQEPEVLQGSYYTTSFDFTASKIKGRKGTVIADQNGYSATLAYKHNSSRWGISYIKVSESPVVSKASSLFGTIGYGTYGYTLFEFAQKEITNTRSKITKSRLGYIESGWEFYKGVIPFLNWEFNKNETLDMTYHAPGMGLQFTPWTHTELWTQFSKTYSDSGNGYSVYTMLNIYF